MAKRKIKKNIMFIVSALSGFVITILLIMLIFDFQTSKFKLSKLPSYIEKEGNYKSISKYYNVNIKTTKDTITINFSNDEVSSYLNGVLDKDILTFEIPKNDPNTLLKGKIIYSVADSLGQINGNDKGYVSSLLGSLDYTTMNINDNGIEIYADKEKYIYKFKVNQKFKLGSVANVYFKETDFLEYKNKLLNEDYFQITQGNLVFYKIEENDKIIMYFGEPKELTSRTYNSLLSLITVMYDSNTSDLFNKDVKKIKTTSFKNINLIKNYKPTDKEVINNKLLEDYKILKIEIN